MNDAAHSPDVMALVVSSLLVVGLSRALRRKFAATASRAARRVRHVARAA